MKKVIKTIESIYLCIRYPFLYPRNRFTGKHFTNFKARSIKDGIFLLQHKYALEHIDKYEKKFGKDCLIEKDDNVCLVIDIGGDLHRFIYGKTDVKSEYIMRKADFFTKVRYWFQKIRIKLEPLHFIPTYTELDGMPNGWRKRFGIQFCKELKRAILHSGGKEYMKEFRIMDIKEKFGELQVYIGSGNDEVYRVIRKYEYLSKFVCIDCGKDAVKQSLGWVSPYCEDCIGDRNWIWIDPIYDWSDLKKKEYNENILKEMP